MSSVLKCSDCRSAIVKVPECTNDNFILLRLRNNGGLLYPNDDVCKIVFTAEKVVKQQKSMKVDKAKIIFSVLRYLDLHNLFSDHQEHFDESSTIWSNHLLSLVKLIASTYIDLRLHHSAKQWNLSTAESNVRQILNRTVIFRHQ